MQPAADPPRPCDLDEGEYNLASAWFDRSLDVWKACRHGVGSMDVLERCGCPKCAGLLEGLRAAWLPRRRPRPAPKPPQTTPVGPVRSHVEALLTSGMSRLEVATAAGVDRTTINRLLRSDVARVHVDCAAKLLAVDSPSNVVSADCCDAQLTSAG